MNTLIFSLRLIAVLIFCTGSLCHAQKEIAYTEVNITANFKQKDKDYIYYITANELTIKIYTEYATENVFIGAFFGKNQAGAWQPFTSSDLTGTNSDLEVFYSEEKKDYLLLISFDTEEGTYYDGYIITKTGFKKVVDFAPKYDSYGNMYLYNSENQKIVSFSNNRFSLKEKDRVGNIVDYIIDPDPYLYERKIDTVSLARLQLLDTALGYNNYQYTLALDLDDDGTPEKYQIDYNNKKVTGLTAAAKKRLASGYKYFTFTPDGLVFKYTPVLLITLLEGYDPDVSFYFKVKPQVNNLFIEKAVKRVLAHSAKGTPYCSFDETYTLGIGYISLDHFDAYLKPKDFFESRDTGYYRQFDPKGLLDIYKRHFDGYFFNLCAKPIDSYEIQLMLEHYPLTVSNVQQYNDIAYYLELMAKDSEKREQDEALYSAAELLNVITEAYPDRAVAWLNLADVRWERGGQKARAVEAYKKYIELMAAQNKDTKKIPARVYERIKAKL